MKKIFFYLCLFLVIGCTGYKPLFLTKDLSFYIKDIKNIKGGDITEKISKNLNSYKLKNNGEKNYTLKISSNLSDNISSRDSKGVALTYKMIIDVSVEVFKENLKITPYELNFSESFIYNNQVYKIKLNRYKKDIQKNLINKISQDIIIKLQSF